MALKKAEFNDDEVPIFEEALACLIHKNKNLRDSLNQKWRLYEIFLMYDADESEWKFDSDVISKSGLI